MIRCADCGGLIVSDSWFCGRCGAPVSRGQFRIYTAGNPFRNFKTRWVIPWTVLGTILTLIVLAIALLVSETETISPTALLVWSVMFYGFIAVWMVWQFRRHGVDIRRLVGRLPANYNWLPMIGIWLATVGFSAGATVVIGYAISLIAPDQLPWLLEEQLIVPDFDSAAYPFLLFASFVIIAPLFEEVFFRGVLINRWGIKWGFNKAIIVPAVLFGLLHDLGMVGIFMFGMVAAILYIRTRTLLVPIAMHALNNLLVLVVSLAFPTERELDTATAVEEVQSLAFVGLALLLLTTPILFWYLRKNWPRPKEMLPYEVSGDGPLLA